MEVLRQQKDEQFGRQSLLGVLALGAGGAGGQGCLAVLPVLPTAALSRLPQFLLFSSRFHSLQEKPEPVQ